MPIDYLKYPKGWLTEIRPRIMKRADNKCEKCKLEHLSFVWAIKLWVKSEGGKYQYQSIWFSSESDAIRENRFGEIRKVKVVLTIAHLDHDEENHEVEDDRLLALCQICHLRYDAQEKYRRSIEKWQSPKLAI